MQVIYEATIKFKVVHEIDTLENMKDNHEYASDIARLVCDEATTAGAVASYEIIESKIDAREETEIDDNKIYKDFMKNSRR